MGPMKNENMPIPSYPDAAAGVAASAAATGTTIAVVGAAADPTAEAQSATAQSRNVKFATDSLVN